jgi:Secretion system C-terminal sorting domain
MKSLSLLSIAFTLCISNANAQYSADFPVFASDNIQSLQGIKQKVGTTVAEWTRPSSNNMDLSKYIGAMAINPSKLNEIFFADNSATPKLYKFNKNTSVETYTGKTFVGASQGTNGSTSLPILQNESAFGINMMAINSSTNTGYAISKEHNFFSFDLTGTNLISAPTLITEALGNPVLFSNSKGGGLMANTRGKLTALVNVLQADLTYKYYYYSIDPVTKKATYVSQTNINYNGFDDNTMYISGAGVTLDGCVYCSLYNGNESSLYKFDEANNVFNVYLATGNQSIGDVTGAGQVVVDLGGAINGTTPLAIDFNELSGIYNAKEKNTTIKWGLFNDEPIINFFIQSSTDGINFKDIATQTPASSYGYNNYSSLINSDKNAIVYYRIAAVRPNNTQKISKVISIDETSKVKASITTYPNPVTNLLNIKLSEAKVISQINIIDTKGQTVAKIKGSSSTIINKQVNLLEYNIASGQYYVQVIFEDQSKQTVALSVKR